MLFVYVCCLFLERVNLFVCVCRLLLDRVNVQAMLWHCALRGSQGSLKRLSDTVHTRRTPLLIGQELDWPLLIGQELDWPLLLLARSWIGLF